MFLKLNNGIIRHAKRDDSGSALVAVIGVLLVTIVIAAVVSASAVHALGYTSATRAGTQSQAAADAGLAAGKAVLMTTGACTTSMTELSSTDPHYRVTIWRATATGSWTLGCPTSTSTQARLISTGYATTNGAAGQSGGDLTYSELILAKEVIQSSGAAIYVGNGGQMNSFTVSSGNGQTADIRVKSGNWECSSSGTFNGNLIVETGKATFSNDTCKVTGYVWAATGVEFTGGGKVGGDVIASNGNVYMTGSNTEIGGNVYANGDFNLNSGLVRGSVEATGGAKVEGGGSRVMGSVWAKSVTSITGHINGNVISSSTATTAISPGSASDLRIGGSATLGGSINSWADSGSCSQHYNAAGYACALRAQGAVTGTITMNVTGLATPTAKAAPTVPAWTDVAYVWSDWQAAGYAQQYLDWPVGQCSVTNATMTQTTNALYAFWQKVLNTTIPTVIDTRTSKCGQILISSSANLDWKLKTNITMIGYGFQLEAVKINSIDTTQRQFNLIVPDGQPTVAGKHCNPNTGSNVLPADKVAGPINLITSPGVRLGATVSGMVYTPCNVTVNNSTLWRGQIYAGSMSFSASDGLVYLPIGIPGINLDGAQNEASISPFKVSSSRGRSDNGGA